MLRSKMRRWGCRATALACAVEPRTLTAAWDRTTGGPEPSGAFGEDIKARYFREFASMVPMWRPTKAPPSPEARTGRTARGHQEGINGETANEAEQGGELLPGIRKELQSLRSEMQQLRVQAALTRTEFSRALDALGSIHAEILSSFPIGLQQRRPFSGCLDLEEFCDSLETVLADRRPLGDKQVQELVWRLAELLAATDGETRHQGAIKRRARQLVATGLHRSAASLSPPAAVGILSVLGILKWPVNSLTQQLIDKATEGISVLSPGLMVEAVTAAGRLKHRFPQLLDAAAIGITPWVGGGAGGLLGGAQLAAAAAAFARLYWPAPALCRQLALALDKEMDAGSLSADAAATLLWSLAVLEELSPARLEKGLAYVESFGASWVLSSIDCDLQRKLFQACLLVCHETPDCAPVLCRILDTELGKGLQHRWTQPDILPNTTVKAEFAFEVKAALHQLAVEFKEQHLDDFLHLDIILSHAREGCRPVVLEIVGPNQLTVTPQEQPLGTVMAQERLIRARGYDPVLICFHEARRAKKEHGPKIGMQRFLQEKLKGKLPDVRTVRDAAPKVVSPPERRSYPKDDEESDSDSDSESGDSDSDSDSDGDNCDWHVEEDEDEAGKGETLALLQRLRHEKDGEAAVREALRSWFLPELREVLRHQGLPVSGRKSVLVDRIVNGIFGK